ncbi:MAG TPA: hypothetical protein VF389_11610 [Woeseiaceae bacterium]
MAKDYGPSPLERAKAAYRPMVSLDELVGLERDESGLAVRFWPQVRKAVQRKDGQHE